jgi:hypothetical protein
MVEYLRRSSKNTRARFGDLHVQSDYERILSLSPFHASLPKEGLKEVLFITDHDFEYAHHTRKLVARLRESSSERERVFFREFASKEEQEMERNLFMYSFAIDSVFYKRTRDFIKD